MLARLVRDECFCPTLGAVQADGDTILNTQDNINAAFMSFYSSLYAAVPGPPKPALFEYLQRLPFPRLNANQIDDLDAPLQLDKLRVAKL
ncbi:hypothetical protein NDU88_003575 [Pleurodeles waltl]|uniref:Uncharacterized protein n=1 Tax=Pleurodeles waltl TaxID=8319 RepID=A0AAV7SGB5_PLEWA|nr:hypothetical protein NDU88_003575 [Pleurodeles waltl]